MLISHKIAIKVIVDEEFKQELLARLRESLGKVEQSRQRLELQGRRYLSDLDGKDAAQAELFRHKLEKQVRRQQEIAAKLTEELSAVERLNPGDEYLQGALDGFSEIKTGDNLSEKLRSSEIVVQGGIVQEVRCG
jgi:hypothetical protein